MDPLDFLHRAKRLLQPEAAEADIRNAVSRAYYAVFHYAKLNADRFSWPSCCGSTHERLFQQYEDNRQEALSYRLRDLHRHRVKADYQLQHVILYSEVKKHLASCEDTLKRAGALQS